MVHLSDLTAAEVRYWLDYDADTGIFTRRVHSGNVAPGKIAGSRSGHGYIQIRVNGVKYVAHRLAWLFVYGAWPSAELDHVNLDKADNRIRNLREATREQNSWNTPAYKSNSSGKKGVSFSQKMGKWQAQIRLDKKPEHLGYYDTIEAAHLAYVSAAKQSRGEFARAA